MEPMLPLDLTRVRDWTPHQVARWFDEMQLPQCRHTILAEGVTGSVLVQLVAHEGLSDLGIEKKLAQSKVYAALEQVLKTAPPPSQKVAGGRGSAGNQLPTADTTDCDSFWLTCMGGITGPAPAERVVQAMVLQPWWTQVTSSPSPPWLQDLAKALSAADATSGKDEVTRFGLNKFSLGKPLHVRTAAFSSQLQGMFKSLQTKNETAYSLFRTLDRDDSGSLNYEELSILLKQVDQRIASDLLLLSDNEVDTYLRRKMREFDTNNSGLLEFEEFILFFNDLKVSFGVIKESQAAKGRPMGQLKNLSADQLLLKQSEHQRSSVKATVQAGVPPPPAKKGQSRRSGGDVETAKRVGERQHAGMDEIARVFKSLDHDNNNALDYAELQKLLPQLDQRLQDDLFRFNPKQLKRYLNGKMREFDTNKNGSLELGEFVKFYHDLRESVCSVIEIHKASGGHVHQLMDLSAEQLLVKWLQQRIRFLEQDQEKRGKSAAAPISYTATSDITLMFAKFDTNQSGALEYDELDQLIRTVDQKMASQMYVFDKKHFHAFLKDKMRPFDVDNSGALDLKEFTHFYADLKRALNDVVQAHTSTNGAVMSGFGHTVKPLKEASSDELMLMHMHQRRMELERDLKGSVIGGVPPPPAKKAPRQSIAAPAKQQPPPPSKSSTKKMPPPPAKKGDAVKRAPPPAAKKAGVVNNAPPVPGRKSIEAEDGWGM